VPVNQLLAHSDRSRRASCPHRFLFYQCDFVPSDFNALLANFIVKRQDTKMLEDENTR